MTRRLKRYMLHALVCSWRGHLMYRKSKSVTLRWMCDRCHYIDPEYARKIGLYP